MNQGGGGPINSSMSGLNNNGATGTSSGEPPPSSGQSSANSKRTASDASMSPNDITKHRSFSVGDMEDADIELISSCNTGDLNFSIPISSVVNNVNCNSSNNSYGDLPEFIEIKSSLEFSRINRINFANFDR